MTTSFGTPAARLAAGCSFAPLIAADGGAAFAHGHSHNGGDRNGNGGQTRSNIGSESHNGKGAHHASSYGGDRGGDHIWQHKYHHRPRKSAGFRPVDGLGSTHNPIVTHSPKISRPIVTVGPGQAAAISQCL